MKFNDFLTYFLTAILIFPNYSNSGKIIILQRRPIFVVHGFLGYCKDPDFINWKKNYGVECLEYAQKTETLKPYKIQIELACNALKDKIEKNPKKFKNGFNIIGSSNGGIIVRGLLQDCPEIRTYVKRMILMGTPNLGITGTSYSPDIIKKDLKYLKYLPTLVKSSITKSIFGEKSPTLFSLKNEKLGHSQYIKHLTRKSDELGNLDILNLEFFGNIVFRNDEIVKPTYSVSFGAFIDKENGSFTEFPDTLAYKKNYLGLKTMYDEGRFMNCLMEGTHVNPTKKEEVDHMFELLKDNCAFDAVAFDQFPDSALYKMCLYIKIVHNNKTRAMTCDPTIDLIKEIPRVKKMIKFVNISQKRVQAD